MFSVFLGLYIVHPPPPPPGGQFVWLAPSHTCFLYFTFRIYRVNGFRSTFHNQSNDLRGTLNELPTRKSNLKMVFSVQLNCCKIHRLTKNYKPKMKFHKLHFHLNKVTRNLRLILLSPFSHHHHLVNCVRNDRDFPTEFLNSILLMQPEKLRETLNLISKVFKLKTHKLT